MAKLTKHPNNKRSLFSIYQRAVSILFLLVFLIILIVTICFTWLPYCGQKDLLLPNIISLLISLLIATVSYFILKKIKLSNKLFNILINVFFILTLITQIIVVIFGYFYTDWDVEVLNILSDNVAQTGTISDSTYLSHYPNNIFLVAFLSVLKSVPFLNGEYTSILIINATLVNLAGIFTCLTVKKISHSNKLALVSTFIIIPLLVLSPWFLIPYSDTFTVLIPILILYLYLSSLKPYWKYSLIVLLGIIGYFMKPSVIIILIAIIVTEIISRRWNKANLFSKTTLKTVGLVATSICFGFLLRAGAYNLVDFKQDSNINPISYPAHYLALGQNDESCGRYSDKDASEAQQGQAFELNKFFSRITNRSCKEQASFFIKKLSVNYNDGTFAWGQEGKFFKTIPERNNPISNTISKVYYTTGKYHPVFTLIEQIIWLFVLFSCLFIFKKSQTKVETTIQLALVGVFAFVMLFEARSRYLITYIPLFVTCCTLGVYHFKNYLQQRKASKN